MIEQHVKELIEENFDPKKADTIFSEEGDISEYCFVFTVFSSRFRSTGARPGLFKCNKNLLACVQKLQNLSL